MRRAIRTCAVAAAVVSLAGVVRLALVAAAALSASGCTSCEISIVTPDPLPEGAVGAPYFFQLQEHDTSCYGRPHWETSDSLPSDMKLSKDGALDGIPLTAGTYSFHVEVWIDDSSSEDSTTVRDERDYTLTIHPRQ